MTQVSVEHYDFHNYDERHRWIAYWYQIGSIARTGATKLLEIGSGTGVLSDYVHRHMDINVTTFDFDPALRPNVVGDVRELTTYFTQNSFDAVCAFQVLEHLPFENFQPILLQMAQVSRQYVIISLPHWGYTTHVRLWFKKWQFVFGRKITRPFKWRFDGQHYWEIGTRGFALDRIVSIIAETYIIERHYFCPDYPYHYFFECRVPN